MPLLTAGHGQHLDALFPKVSVDGLLLFASEKAIQCLLKPEAYFFLYLPQSYDEVVKDFILQTTSLHVDHFFGVI